MTPLRFMVTSINLLPEHAIVNAQFQVTGNVPAHSMQFGLTREQAAEYEPRSVVHVDSGGIAMKCVASGLIILALVSVLFCCLSLVGLGGPVSAGLSVRITADPVTITLGESVHLVGTVTNDANRDLVLYHVQVYAYLQGCANAYPIQLDKVPIASGQTLSFGCDVTPLSPCTGVWDAAISVQPKKLVSGQNYLVAETEFTVQ